MNEYSLGSTPPPVPGNTRDRRSPPPRISGGLEKIVGVPAMLVVALVLISGFVWFFCRIEPGRDRIAILIRKSGEPLSTGQIISSKPGQKGIQEKVLPEGRYFRNPYTWGWIYRSVTDIPAGKMGVQTRLFGDSVPSGQVLAGPGQKGIVPEILAPGKYRINPFAYSVRIMDAITIPPGHVGVLTSLTGSDPVRDNLPAGQRNNFVVADGMKGVLTRLLDPGTHYLNPHVYGVTEVSLQSQRFEMSGDDAIAFLTLDGFTVTVEGTLEFSVRRDNAAVLAHRVGDMDDIVKKIILPRARGFSRIEGSKNKATNYIIGESRQQFQNVLEQHLRKQCAEWGVDIKSVLIRNIRPPDEIASVIRDREVAVQEARKYDQQIEQARSKAELTRQEMLAVQNRVKVESETARIRAVIQAEQEQAVRLTAATREMEVAQLENDAATFQAQAIVRKAEADGAVIRFDNESQAAVIRNQVSAFGTGLQFSRYMFYLAVAPRIESLLTTDDSDSFGALFKSFMPAAGAPARKEVTP